MGKNNKCRKILNKVKDNLNVCDIIIMNIFKNYTCKIYRIGFKDAFNWENKRVIVRKNAQGCSKAVNENNKILNSLEIKDFERW